MISSPASSGSSLSTSSRCAWPPSNKVVNRLRKWPSTCSNAASRRTRPSRLRLPIEPRRRLIASCSSSRSAAPDARLASSSASSCSATRLTGPIRSRSAVSRSNVSRSTSGGVERGRVEAELAGQQRRRAFELLAAFAAQLEPPRFLRLGPRDRAGPRLARRGEAFAGIGQRPSGDGDGFLRVAFGLGRARDLGLARRRVALQPRRSRAPSRSGSPANSSCSSSIAMARVVVSARRLSAISARVRHSPASRPAAAWRSRSDAVSRARVAERARQSATASPAAIAAARAASISTASAAGSGSVAERFGRRLDRAGGLPRPGGEVGLPFDQRRALAVEPFERGRRPNRRRAPHRARPARRRRRRRGPARQRRAGLDRGGGGVARRLRQRRATVRAPGSCAVDLGQAVGAEQPLRRRRAAADADEPVPAPHHPVAGDQPLADGERLARRRASATPTCARRRASAVGRLDMVEQPFEAGGERGVASRRRAAFPAPRARRSPSAASISSPSAAASARS